MTKFHTQELGSYAQGQGSLAVFKVTARDQGHYKGPSGAFVTYCNISCSIKISLLSTAIKLLNLGKESKHSLCLLAKLNKLIVLVSIHLQISI